jgi:hypothetical protein
VGSSSWCRTSYTICPPGVSPCWREVTPAFGGLVGLSDLILKSALFARVSKDGSESTRCGHPSRPAQERGPQDDGGVCRDRSRINHSNHEANTPPRSRRCIAQVLPVRFALKPKGAGLPQEGSRECRTLGASAAACAVVESTRVSHHGHAGNVRHSPRNGFNGFLRALPGDRALLPPSPPRSSASRELDASVGASGPHDFAVREPSAFVNALPASTASCPASVTISSRPSVGQDGGG